MANLEELLKEQGVSMEQLVPVKRRIGGVRLTAYQGEKTVSVSIIKDDMAKLSVMHQEGSKVVGRERFIKDPLLVEEVASAIASREACAV
jgi:hypothetical protein